MMMKKKKKNTEAGDNDNNDDNDVTWCYTGLIETLNLSRMRKFLNRQQIEITHRENENEKL